MKEEINKDKLARLVDIINRAECNCEEIRIPLCGRCQIQKGIILDMMEAKDVKLGDSE